MKNYIIDCDIDFYSEINQSLSDDKKLSIKEQSNDQQKCCLIDKTPLSEYFVKLPCGHSFNYVPLFKDLCNHKIKYNKKERSNRLKKNQIRCPYCRIVSNELIPFYENYIFNNNEKIPKVYGVNWYFPKESYKYCEFVLNTNSTGFDEICEDIIYLENDKTYIHLDKYYCHKHKQIVIKKNNKIQREEAKLKAKKEKEEAKLKAKKEKEEAKLKAKQEKQDAKLKAKQEKQEAKLKSKKEKELNK